MTVTDEMLMAYVDGELDADAVAAVDAALAGDPDLAARLARHRLLSGAVAGAYAGVAEEPVPERLLAAVRSPVEPAKVVSLDAFRKPKAAAPAPSWNRWGMIAAGLVAGLAVGLGIPRGEAPMVGGDMKAHGQLASALESQLASSPKKDALVRVGLTVRDRDGRYCRTFTMTRNPGPAGLACRDANGWTVRMAVAQTGGRGAGDFRTAAADTPPEVIAAVEALMQGEPLDAGAEAAARVKGWR